MFRILKSKTILICNLLKKKSYKSDTQMHENQTQKLNYCLVHKRLKACCKKKLWNFIKKTPPGMKNLHD